MKRLNEYGQFCPVAMTAEIMAVRWTPLVIRELLSDSHRFSDIQKGLPLMSPSLLSTRLKELEHAGIVRRQKSSSGKGSEYYLTEAGQELRPIVELYGAWAQKWYTQEYTEEDLDPSLLMWDVRRRIDRTHLPGGARTVVQFELSATKHRQKLWWLVCEDGDPDLCLKDPGHEIDLYVYAPLRTLTEIWMGRRKLAAALEAGEIRMEGNSSQVKSFPKWFLLNIFADMAV